MANATARARRNRLKQEGHGTSAEAVTHRRVRSEIGRVNLIDAGLATPGFEVIENALAQEARKNEERKTEHEQTPSRHEGR